MSGFVLGLGFRAAATEESFRSAIAAAVAAVGEAPSAIAVPADKRDHSGLRAVARQCAVELIGVVPDDLKIASAATVTHSPRVDRLRGVGSVCEAAALAIAGPNASLVLTRKISDDRLVTVAAARPGAPT